MTTTDDRLVRFDRERTAARNALGVYLLTLPKDEAAGVSQMIAAYVAACVRHDRQRMIQRMEKERRILESARRAARDFESPLDELFNLARQTRP